MFMLASSSLAALVVAATPGHANAARILNPAPAAPTASEADFVWPKTVMELIERDPKYIERWLIGRKCPDALIADYAQDLLLHLLTPSNACTRKGCPDKLGLYDPALLGGATTKRAWAYWLSKYLLTNQYSKLISRQRRSGCEGPTVVSITETEHDVERAAPSWHALLTVNERQLFETSHEEVYGGVTSQIRVDQIMQAVAEEIGAEAVEILQAVKATDNAIEAAELLGVPADRVRRILRTVRATIQSVLSAEDGLPERKTVAA